MFQTTNEKYLLEFHQPHLIAAQDELRQLHLHVQRVLGPLELQHQHAVGVAEDA